MESYALPHMPSELSQIHICLFKNVSNTKAIKTSLIAASSMNGPEGDDERDKYDFCFVEGNVVSPFLVFNRSTCKEEGRKEGLS